MNRILLATESTDLPARVQDATGRAVSVLPAIRQSSDTAHLLEQLSNGTTRAIVLLDCTTGDSRENLRLSDLLQRRPFASPVVLISDAPGEMGLEALRAGVVDVLDAAADADQIRNALDRAERSVPAVPSEEPAAPSGGRVIGVVSPKGGTGKTLLATNLAVGLARAEPHSTVLVDLDTQFGDVSSALDLHPEYTLKDAVRGPAARDTMVLKTFLTRHATGLHVVCGPEAPADADAITPDDVGQLLRMLASEFRYVVVDTAPGLPEHTLSALDHTTDLLLVTSMDVPGVRGLRKELDVLGRLGMLPEARHVVVNFADSRGGLTRADVEATLGTPVDLLLPRSKCATASVNQGIPLLQSGERDPLTKLLRRLVDRFLPAGAGTAGPLLDGGPGRAMRRFGPKRSRSAAESGTHARQETISGQEGPAVQAQPALEPAQAENAHDRPRTIPTDPATGGRGGRHRARRGGEK